MNPATANRGSACAPWRLWALASLILFGQLAGFVHLSSVEHTVCDEHGELVHESHGEHAVEVDPSSEPGHLRLAPDVAEHADHDHCATMLGTREEWSAGSAVSHDLAGYAPALAEPVSSQVARAPKLARYRLAPKQSPPC